MMTKSKRFAARDIAEMWSRLRNGEHRTKDVLKDRVFYMMVCETATLLPKPKMAPLINHCCKIEKLQAQTYHATGPPGIVAQV
jgi:hypothetical protein